VSDNPKLFTVAFAFTVPCLWVGIFYSPKKL